MSPVIRISDILHQRLEKHAAGFDTPANVIERLLDTIEGVNPRDKLEKVVLESNDTLPIKLEPEDVDLFKELLLEKQKASIKIIYNDGNTEIKHWNASRFTENSEVMANLRSRKEFRQGTWQYLEIREVIVSIESEDNYKEKVVNKKISKIESWSNNLDNYNSKIIQIYLENSDNNLGVDKCLFLSEIENAGIPKPNYDQMRTNGSNSNGLIFQGKDRITMYDDSYKETLRCFKM